MSSMQDEKSQFTCNQCDCSAKYKGIEGNQEITKATGARRPKGVDDFIRNFLTRHKMMRTLAAFQCEWHELQQGDQEPVPDCYMQIEHLESKVKFLQKDSDKMRRVAEPEKVLVKQEEMEFLNPNDSTIQSQSTVSMPLYSINSGLYKQDNGSEEIRIFMCNECNFSSKYKRSLTVHLRKHTGERPYKCTKCNYASTQSGILVQHLKMHSNDRPFQCNTCGWRGITKQKLVAHTRKHTGERPFICETCSKSFSRRHHLTNHTKLHNPALKPFTCDKCDYSCMRKQYLVSHVSRVHLS